MPKIDTDTPIDTSNSPLSCSGVKNAITQPKQIAIGRSQ